jgi:hypothetical protein
MNKLYMEDSKNNRGFIAMHQFGHFGRLGNQMFQLAFLTAKAIDNNLDIIISKPVSEDDKHHYQLEDIFDLTPLPKKWQVKNMMKVKTLISEKFEFGKDVQFDTIKEGQNTCVRGYFQSWKYWFPKHKHAIDVLFTFKQTITESATKKWEQLCIPSDIRTVSLHIRRGDYIGNIYNMITPNYIITAISMLPLDTNIVVFSDDIKWCKNHIPSIVGKVKEFKGHIYYFEGSQGEDMYAMTLCDNNIIASSSFSWWGAYLNKHPNKIVIAPTKWFNEQAPIQYSNLRNSIVDNLHMEDWISVV